MPNDEHFTATAFNGLIKETRGAKVTQYERVPSGFELTFRTRWYCSIYHLIPNSSRQDLLERQSHL